MRIRALSNVTKRMPPWALTLTASLLLLVGLYAVLALIAVLPSLLGSLFTASFLSVLWSAAPMIGILFVLIIIAAIALNDL